MSKTYSDADLEVRLWSEIRKSHFGMLAAPSDDFARQCAPMTAFPEPIEKTLWFFTSNESDLTRAAGDGGAEAVFVFQSKDQDLHACLSGRLHLSRDKERIDRYWSAQVAAWYKNGKKDPNLAMLRFDVAEAQVWLSETGPLKYAWEILKGNLTAATPDIGEHVRFEMRH
ncbi:MAG TPA: pyridoxamine 5'-phosphate oxidase family protein [Caulobacteraceae bacterium]|jgi:general stress protein 26|nr:pyridoxamine 5'-phosphate oxidase family protein [Caulobacteraceae bacterium]